MPIVAVDLARPPWLRELTFSLAAGELLIVTGDHGAGKTTLLRCLAGVDNHTGTVTATGHTRLIPATPELDPGLSVGEAVDAAGLDRWGLCEHAAKLPHMLSRGTAARAQLAQAFSARPDTYLFDEPFNGLDRQGRDLLVVLISEALEAGAAVIVATHDASPFDALNPRVLTLS